MMQRARKCDCTTRALGAFVKDLAGLRIQSHIIHPSPLLQRQTQHASTQRLFGTGRKLDASSCSPLQTVDSAKLPSQDTPPLEHEMHLPRLDSSIPVKSTVQSSIPVKSRMQSRLERKHRRIAAQNAETEQADLEAAKLKKRLRRERKRLEAAGIQSTRSPMDTPFITNNAADASSKPARAKTVKTTRSKTAVESSTAANMSMKTKKGSEVSKTASTAPTAAKVAKKAEKFSEASRTKNVSGLSDTKKLSEASRTKNVSGLSNTKKLSEASRTKNVSGLSNTKKLSEASRTKNGSGLSNTKKLSEMSKTKKVSEVSKTKKLAEMSKTVSLASTIRSGRDADEGSEKGGRSMEAWGIQKAALQAKFGDQNWNPRKRISPDALAGIRMMHAQQPEIFNTEVLATHFKVSAEAVRRILKSKWQPDEEAAADRRKRWERRGARKWSEMVELGIRPPKKWREMGIGRVAGKGEKPTWKKGGRAGERWIEQAQSDAFIVAGDMAAEESVGRSLGDRIV